MKRLRSWMLRFAGLFGRARRDQELAAELDAHLQMHIEENIRRGMTPAEARRQALIASGGMEQAKEIYRQRRGWPTLESFFADLHFALRMLRKSPGFTAVAVLTLALGIGANTAIFSVVNGVLLNPLPYPDSGRIVHLGWQSENSLIPNLSTPEFQFIRDHNISFSSVAGIRDYEDQELKIGAETQWIKAQYVTAGFFETLGINLQLGNPFGREFTRAGGSYAAVLTDSLWRASFHADPNIVGRQIILGKQAYIITGVLPPGFKYTQPADLFASLHFGKGLGDAGSNTDVIARLKPGLPLSQAQAQMPALTQEFRAQASKIEQQGPGDLHLDRYRDYLGGDYRTTLLMLLSAVGLLLLIACANVASLLLARASARQNEISIRLALGATRRRLFRQFLVEGLLLGLFGAAAGLVGALAILRTFVSAIPWDLPAMDRITPDARVLVFTLLVGIGTSVAFCLASFLRTRGLDLNATLKNSRAVNGLVRSRSAFLNALVVSEVAISLMLAIGAGLLIDSIYHLQEEKLGFNPAHLLLMQTPFGPMFASSNRKMWNFEREALQRIEAIPGVQSAAVVSAAPLHSRGNLPMQRDGHPEDSIGGTEYRMISANYFSTMQIPVLRGRVFEQGDFSSQSPVAVINETLARAWWPGQNPLGDRLVVGEFQGHTFPGLEPQTVQIVGVVGDVKGLSIGAPVPPMVYAPASEGSFAGSTDWVVRTSSTSGMAIALRRAITGVAPDQRILDLEPMSRLISASIAQPSFEASLMGMFGGLALALTLVGVYGVLSFHVAERSHEIGIRMALGASRLQIMRLVLGKAAKFTVIGVLIGLLAGFALTRLIVSLLYHVQPADPLVFAAIAILVLLVAMLAAYIPARRAMRVDPMVALRHE